MNASPPPGRVLLLHRALVVGTLCAATASHAGWIEVGGGTFNAGPGAYNEPSLAMVSGVPHVAYLDATGENILVKKLVGGVWTGVGANVNADPILHASQIAAFNGAPCVGYVDLIQSTYTGRVRCWNGTAWTALGADVTTAQAGAPGFDGLDSVSLVSSGSYLAVGFMRGYTFNVLQVYVWTGAAWELRGNGTHIDSYVATLTLDGSVPYAAYREDVVGDFDMYVSQWSSGTSWTQIGSYFRTGFGPLVHMLGALHFVTGKDQTLKLNRWNGSTWGQLGGDLSSALSSLNLGTDGTYPYLVYTENGVAAKRLKDGAWEHLQGTIPGASIGGAALGFLGGVPYVAWRGDDIRLSYWQAGTGSAVLVPESDRAGTVEWSRKTMASCSSVTTALYSVVNEVRSPWSDNDCTVGSYDASYLETPTAPTAANLVAFELTSPPADFVSGSGGNVVLRFRKTANKTGTITFWLRKADGTLLTTATATATTTLTYVSFPFGPVSLSRADVEGLYIEVTGSVTDGGSATAIILSSVNLELTYQEAPNRGPGPPTLVAPIGTVSTTTPTLSVVFNDPDPGDLGQLTFTLCQSISAQSCWAGAASSVPSGGTGSWTVTSPLTIDTWYYFFAEATDAAGATSERSPWWSFRVVASTDPSIVDNQAGDDTSRASNTGTYDVDFSAPLGLAGFDVRVYSGAAQTGTLLQDWVQVSTLSGTTATANWALPSSTWAALQEGTNYISVRLRDAASNQATLTDAFYVRKDTLPPAVDITSPAAGSYVNAANQASFIVGGTCSESGQVVSVGGAGSGSGTCSGGAWSATVNVSAAAQGAFTLTANLQDAAGNAAPQASRTFTKDSLLPAVSLSAPGGQFITSANQGSLLLGGTCSEDGRAVILSGDLSATPTCSGGTWSSTVDAAGLADGTRTFHADHQDAAGNAATRATLALTKDLSPPAAGPVRDGPIGDLDVQGSTAVLEANWDAFFDLQSGVVDYAWAIGSSPGAEDVRTFTSVGNQRAGTATGLALAFAATYYVSVRATNGAGLATVATSDGVQIEDPLPHLVREGNDRGAMGVPYQYGVDGHVRVSAGAPVTFSACGGPPELSIDPASGLVSWTPTNPGTISLCVRAANEAGEDVYSFDVQVIWPPPPPPVARFEVSPPSPVAPVSVTFDGSTSWADPSALPLRYHWDPGDGTEVGAGVRWTHLYTTRGYHTATLIVVDRFGQSATSVVTLDLGVRRSHQIGCGCAQSDPTTLLLLALGALWPILRKRRASNVAKCP